MHQNRQRATRFVFLPRLNHRLSGLMFLVLLMLFSLPGMAQFKLYEDAFNGGVVTGGYSCGISAAATSGSFVVSIPPGSTIRQAYLLAGRCGNLNPITVNLNGSGVTFDLSNQATSGFTTNFGGLSAVHAADVTALISPSTTNYTISVPGQGFTSDKFPDFYLWIAYNNASMPVTSAAIFLNTTNLNVASYTWNLATSAPISTLNPVGLAFFGGYISPNDDCQNVSVNGTALGAMHGPDFNGNGVWGVMAGFQYASNALLGYGDDLADQVVNGADALSDIAAIIPNSSNMVPVVFSHCTGRDENHIWASMLTWNGSAPLDSDFLSFEAEPEGEAVKLQWSVAEAQVGTRFEIEKSLDGAQFAPYQAVFSEGKATSFSSVDAVPLPGSNFYRIAAPGLNGQTIVSEVREVWVENVQGLTVSPNPIRAGTVGRISGLERKDFVWELYTVAGNEVVLKGDGAEVPTAELKEGLYVLRVSTNAAWKSVKLVVR